jgi:autophagy-related protein 2
VNISSAGTVAGVELHNLEFEYHVRFLEIFDEPPPSDVNSSRSANVELADSVATIRDTVLTIPVRLVDCVVGLSPLHLPSHACLIISSGSAAIRQSSATKSVAVTVTIGKASLLMVDDRKYLSSMGADTHRKHSHGSSLALQYLAQGYVSIGIINSVETSVSVSSSSDCGKNNKVELRLSLTIDNVYLKSCADSTHSLIQLVNDLKPVVEPPPPELKYRTTVPGGAVDVMANVDNDIFLAGNIVRRRASSSDQTGGSGNFFAEDADLVDDDVPTNLEFIESYYGGPGAGERSGTGLSLSGSGGLHSSYSNTDLLLQEDLSVMVARNNLDHSHPAADKVVDFNGSKSVASFEQRVQLHDSVLNFEENHFGRPKTSHRPVALAAKHHTTRLSPTSFSDGESDDEFDRRSASDTGTAEIPSYIQGRNPVATAATKTSLMSSTDARSPPISIDFQVNNFTWDMHDGYDWKYTRDVITQAISRVEYEAKEIRRFQTEEEAAYNQAVRQEIHSDGEDADLGEEEEGEDVVADVLFNSIYISMSTHQNANDLRKMINKDINDDNASETTSITSSAPSSHASTPFRPSPSLTKELRQNHLKSLKLKRSKQHKVKIHLTGIHGNMSLFAGVNDKLHIDGNDPLAHLLNRLDLRVTDAEILDNVATSTWNKFLTYMRSEGDREEGASMVHVIMENVKPVADLATSEIVLNVFVLPLRLHVDQDTLDFITRFFEFQDDRFDSLMAGLQDEIPFIQKADIRAIKVKLDYKPKKIDYAGLRSGHTTEFMNFFILDEAEMVLNHVKLYGVAGFPRLGVMLNGIWMPDIRSNQLGDVLAGLAPVRSIVRLGSGLRDLVVVPVREYRKDGRVIRSLQKGAWQFARNTTSELVKFGAKLAAGTQTFLEQAEQALGGVGAAGRQAAGSVDIYAGISDDSDNDNEDYAEAGARVRFDTSGQKPKDASADSGSKNKEAVSLYANQPLTLAQGIYSAYDSLGHNLGLAKTAVAGIKSDAVASGSAGGTAKAIMRATPIALIRPMIGATEAVSRTLLGATNQMDPNQAQDVEEKYKRVAPPATKKK